MLKERMRTLEKLYKGRINLADLCGISDRTIGNTLYRRGGFSEATLMALHNGTNVSIDWLMGLTGTDDKAIFINGEMINNE